MVELVKHDRFDLPDVQLDENNEDHFPRILARRVKQPMIGNSWLS